MKNYKVVWKVYNANRLIGHEPVEFEEEVNKLANQGWVVKSSNSIALKMAGVDWIVFYALMEKAK